MPAKQVRSRPLVFVSRDHQELLAIVLVVLLSVLELLSDPAADLDTQVIRNGQVTSVEQRVEVRAQEQSVRNNMGSVHRIRADVSRFENWERPLASDCATSGIGFGHQHPKRT